MSLPPARAARQTVHVKPLGPHRAPPAADVPLPLRDPVSTFTEPKIRFAFDDPHSTHAGVKPAVYAAIEARMENCLLQSWQMYW